MPRKHGSTEVAAFSPRRRTFLQTCGLGSLALVMPRSVTPLSGQQAQGAEARPTSTMLADLASWVARVKYEDFPPHVIAKAKRLLLDTIGCAIGAIDGEPVRIAAEVVRQQGGNQQATVIGGGWKASAEQATFLNALAIRYLDFNDYAAFGYPHHPSINVGAALAIAEMQGLSGKDVLLGLTVAYEVHIRFRDFSADGQGYQRRAEARVRPAVDRSAVCLRRGRREAARPRRGEARQRAGHRRKLRQYACAKFGAAVNWGWPRDRPRRSPRRTAPSPRSSHAPA